LRPFERSLTPMSNADTTRPCGSSCCNEDELPRRLRRLASEGHGRLGRVSPARERLNRPPHGSPGRAQLPGKTGHRGVLATQLTDRPPTRPRGQQRPRTCEVALGLGLPTSG
jgi:hypothetical protein